MILLYLAALYCLADAFLFSQFSIRLRPVHLTFHPSNFISSGKRLIPLFLLCCAALWWLPFVSLALILFAPWPHPFFTAYRDLTQKKPQANFPPSKSQTGAKLFSLPTDDRPHLIFLVLESFRAKNVGCLGAQLSLSPHFDALANQGLLFTRFHSTGNLTNRSIIASLFGLPAAHRPWNLSHYADLPLVGLPQILSRHNYHPALIKGGSTAFDHEAEFFSKQGFKTILGKRDIDKPGTSWGVFDEHLMPYAVSWLAAQKEPTFLKLCTVTNHHPWIHPNQSESFLDTFAYTDQALALFIDEMKKNNLLEKSILFIFGDHGQELEDRDPHFAINRHLYQDNVHVPLLIYAPTRLQPGRIDTLASQTDLLPTVLDLFNLSDPHHSLGKSLLRPSSAPIYFSHPFDSPIIGCRQDNWKYLLEGEKEELYDLNSDPNELVNLIGQGPSLKKQTLAYFERLDEAYSKPKEEKSSSLHLDLSHSLITDEELLQTVHPQLASLSLAHCLLLTNQGIGSLLKLCPKLEKLILDGLDDITGENWPPLPHLTQLRALQCPHFKSSWLCSLPSLQILQIGSAPLSDTDLLSLAQVQKNLTALYLEQLPEITDQGLSPLLQANPYLMVLSLQSCSQISPSALESYKGELLRYLRGCFK